MSFNRVAAVTFGMMIRSTPVSFGALGTPLRVAVQGGLQREAMTAAQQAKGLQWADFFSVVVSAVEIERPALPPTAVYRAFTPRHLAGDKDLVEVGASLLVVGFPLGFHDRLCLATMSTQSLSAKRLPFGVCHCARLS